MAKTRWHRGQHHGEKVSFEDLPLADRSRAVLIGSAAEPLVALRTRVYGHLQSHIHRELLVQEYMGGSAQEEFREPLRVTLKINAPEGIAAFDALFAESPLL